MTNLIIFILCVYGISNIMVFSNGPFMMFDKIRNLFDKLPSNLGEIFHCMICFPTWVGIFLSIINMVFIPNTFFTPFYSIFGSTEMWYIIIFLDGFIASGSTWILHTIQEYFEKE